MAGVNLGKVSITPRDFYSPAKRYNFLDLVYETNTASSYLAKKTSIGILLSNEEYWMPIAKGGQGIPGPQGQRGEKGETGKGLDVKSYFNTELDLRTANPDHNYMYGVGIAQPYDIWGWDELNGAWINNGKLQGADGKSAFNIAVDNGFTGTQQEWIESLKGEHGERGAQGVQGATGIPGAQGIQGIQGIQGERGTQGEQGTPTTVNEKTGTTITLAADDIKTASGASVQTELDGKAPIFISQEKDLIMVGGCYPHEHAKCRKTQDGFVFIYGEVANDVRIPEGTPFCYLPEGFYPKYTTEVAVMAGVGVHAYLSIATHGEVFFDATSGVTRVYLNCFFPLNF